MKLLTPGFALALLLHLACAGGKSSPLTPTLAEPRAYHTATLLQDGRVLLAGGWKTDPSVNALRNLATAELFDPARHTLRSVGPMAKARVFHCATLLNNGKVLMTGGYDERIDTLASAELFDPATGQFLPTGSMAQKRVKHTATLLADGRVLVVGGEGGVRDLATAELYDPGTGTFSPTGPMVQPRMQHSATLMADGRVLVAGGWNSYPDFLYLSSAELYDPATETFSPTGSLQTERCGHTATLLPGGKVLLISGYNGIHSEPSSGELYDPSLGRFTQLPMAEGRISPGAVGLPDGRVLVLGGLKTIWKDPYYETLSSVEQYDPSTGKFGSSKPLISPRQAHTATLLKDGRVFLAGGRILAEELNTTEFYP